VVNFDIDCCQVLWDGERALATPSAVRALRTGINIADPERRKRSEDYEYRLAKYAARGFLVAVPGLDVNKIKEEYVRDSCFGFHKGHLKKIQLTFREGEERPDVQADENSVTGMAKLTVFSTLYVMNSIEDNDLRRRQDGESRWPGKPAGSLGTGHYMLDYAKIEGGRYMGVWKRRTPPYPPPLSVLSQVEYARKELLDTVGVDIMPWNKSPGEVLQILLGSDVEGDAQSFPIIDDQNQKRLVCFDYLA